MNATLLIISGNDQGSRFELLGFEPVTIGRGIHNVIRLNDSEISRQHAQLDYKQNRWVFTDRNSSNGSVINGSTVSSHVLRNGDRVRIGGSLLLFQTMADDDQTVVQDEQFELIGNDGSSTLSQKSQIVGSVDAKHALSVHDAVSHFIDGDNEAAQHLRALYQISEEALSPSKSLDELLQSILQLTVKAVGAQRGCILLSEDGGEPRPRVLQTDSPGDRLPISMTIVQHALNSRTAVRTTDAQTDKRFDGNSIHDAGIREAMCIPIQGFSEQLGAIYLDRAASVMAMFDGQTDRDSFQESHLRLVLTIGRQTAMVVESKRFEQSLVKAERFAAMGQTIAMISHHIKNIVQGVSGGSYLIEMGLNKPDEQLIRKGRNIVDNNTGRILNLVQDLLTYSKEREPQLQMAHLNDVIGEVCELMQARAMECGIEFQTNFTDTVPVSLFDTDGIHRAVLNVITNAIDAVENEDKPCIEVRTLFDEAKSSLIVVVLDNGPGIPDDMADTIFDVFESSKGFRGTGLGLAVSRKILNEHGGSLHFDSPPGKGTQFVLAWPHAIAESDSSDGLDGGTLT